MPLAPAGAAMPMVVEQLAVALVKGSNCAPPTAAPPPSTLAMNGVDPQLLRTSGYDAGQLSGVLSGPETLNLQPDDHMGGTVNVVGFAVLVLAGQVNNPNGNFVLSGSSKQDMVMVMGRLDQGTNAMQGNWFFSALGRRARRQQAKVLRLSGKATEAESAATIKGTRPS